MSLVLGKDCVFYIFDAGLWKPYICSRSGNFAIDTEMIETSVTGSGGYYTGRPGKHSFTASFDGIISLNDPTSLTLPELQALQLARTKMLIRFTEVSKGGDVYTKEGYAFITNSTDTGAFDGVATFQISMKGTGGITQVFILPPPIIQGKVYRYPSPGSTAPATVGSLSFLATGLANKDIISVFKDGMARNNIILTGIPVNQEVLYETVGGDGLFTFPQPFEDDNCYIEYQNL